MLTQIFQICGGSIVGTNHMGQPGVLLGKNNQDAFGIKFQDDAIMAVVCDGCSAEPYSEFGARLGVDLIQAHIAQCLTRFSPFGDPTHAQAFWQEVRNDSLAQMRVLAKALSGQQSYTTFVKERLLFTCVVLLIGQEETQVVAIGDGTVVCNDQAIPIGPYPQNKPPYLAYSLIDTEFSSTPELLQFQKVLTIPTLELQHLLIGSDGVQEIIEKAETKLPGRQETLGPLSKFWSEDFFFQNKDAVRRRLSAANSAKMHVDRKNMDWSVHQPILTDDTTLIVARRKPTVS